MEAAAAGASIFDRCSLPEIFAELWSSEVTPIKSISDQKASLNPQVASQYQNIPFE